MFVHLYHFWLPFIEVNGLDLGDVDLKLTVLAGAAETHKRAEGNRGPPGRLGVAISALFVILLLQKGFQDLDLHVDIHYTVS